VSDARVRFYRDALRLYEDVAEFLSEGLRQGEGALATDEHQQGFREALAQRAVNVDAFLASGQVQTLDALPLLGDLLAGGVSRGEVPDVGAFRDVVWGALNGLHSRYGGVRVYSEMAGLLSVSGDAAAARRIEHFWQEWAEARWLSIYRGYPLGRVSDGR
jgi:hypothetical protein